MTIMNKFATVLGVIGVLVLSGCDTMNTPSSASGSGEINTGSTYSEYGVVQSVDIVQQGNTGNTGIGGSGVGIGTIAGAVIGGVLGNQVGGGTGRTVATVAGAAGGAYVGHELENRQQQRTTDAYRIAIRMNNGSYQTLTQSENTNLRVGDRVRIDNGVARRY